MGSSSTKDRLLVGQPSNTQMQQLSQTFNMPIARLNLLKQKYAMYKSKNQKINVFNYLILHREFINANATDTEVYKSFNAFDKDRDGFLDFLEMIRALSMQTPQTGAVQVVQRAATPPPQQIQMQPQTQPIMQQIINRPVYQPPLQLQPQPQPQQTYIREYVAPTSYIPPPPPQLETKVLVPLESPELPDRVIYRKRQSAPVSRSYSSRTPVVHSSYSSRTPITRSSYSTRTPVSRTSSIKNVVYMRTRADEEDENFNYDEDTYQPKYESKRKRKVRKVTVYVPKQSPIISRRLHKSRSTHVSHPDYEFDYRDNNDNGYEYDDYRRHHKSREYYYD